MMKDSTKDKLTGDAHEVKGAVKELGGRLTGNDQLETDGKVEKLAGKIQKKVGQVETVVEK
jgi:uncharacterized protein YjbJ (UPF0337 family)